MKNKAILSLLFILLCCGCGETTVDKKYTNSSVNDDFYIYIDSDTCLEYFVSNGYYNYGNVFPRYNEDGTIRQNKKCLKDKEYNDEK